MSAESISLQKLRNCIEGTKCESYATPSFTNGESFFIYEESNPKYIDPLMTQCPGTGLSDYSVAQIIFVSAAGATGKTEMTRHLSNKYKIPVLDLSKHKPVGNHSFIGMLFKTFNTQDAATIMEGIQNGSQVVIIDGFDEGYSKTSDNAFESFMDDIANLAMNAKGLTFLIFGRNNIIDYSSLYFAEKGIKVSLLLIEPFIVNSACDFIDKQVTKEVYQTHYAQYKSVRDYIIESLHIFFKNESEIKKQGDGEALFNRFIGYAPVLLSISELLKESRNYDKLLSELRRNQSKNIQLIIDIVEMVLNREKSKLDEPLCGLLVGRDDTFSQSVKEQAYNIEEQCMRLLYRSEGFNSYIREITSDDKFNDEYNKKVEQWFVEHPFLDSKTNKFANSVFENYVLAKLLFNDDKSDEVELFLSNYGCDSILFFEFCNVLSNAYSREIPQYVIPYLIASFQSVDMSDNVGVVSISVDNDCADENGCYACSIEFSRNGYADTIEFLFKINFDSPVQLPAVLSHITIDAPISLYIKSEKILFIAPVSINVRKLTLDVNDCQVRPSGEDKSVVVESEEMTACSSAGIPRLNICSSVDLKIFTDSTLSFPFVTHKQDLKKICDDSQLFDKYKKLRRIILHFRSHSKGLLAKYKDKINNRIGDKSPGKEVLNSLIEKGVIYTKEEMYCIDDTKFSEVLGVNFDGIRSFEINDLTKKFLSQINVDKSK